MQPLRVELGERAYDIAIGSNVVASFGAFARERAKGTTAVVVTDGNVSEHAENIHQALLAVGLKGSLIVLHAGEDQKCLSSAEALYDWLAEARVDRKTLVCAVGGGVIGDLAGFVAATYTRGLPLLMVPTTLLAMVDSSVGGKVGINHPSGKNLIGAFHQPVGVWIDTAYLDTLPDREYVSGLAEVVKYGIILDAELFAYLEKNAEALLRREPGVVVHIVRESCRLKASVVERDERELTGVRACLNYGHTFAHAFETVAGYGTWLHGEAVAAGMACAARLARKRGLIPADIEKRQDRLLQTFGLPTRPLPEWEANELIEVMGSDKKAEAGKLRFVLPVRLGEVQLMEVPEAEVRKVLAEMVR